MPTRWRNLCLLLIAALFAAFVSAARPASAGVRPAAPLAQSCENLVNNGGFEIDFGWEFDPSPVPPVALNTIARSDNRSLQLGIPPTAANLNASSAARQRVSIPADASSAILSFWYYPIAEASPGADYFEFAVLNADGSALLAGPWRLPVGFEWWQQSLFDFSAWRGQTFQLFFNVYNDGGGGRTVVFLDDVSLATCPTPAGTATPTVTPWPTPVWTPWPTPVPTSWPTAPPTAPPPPGCFDVLQNGSFDAGLAGWVAGNNPLRPSLVGDPALSPPYAVELGSTVQNLNSFSSIRQTVAMPAGFRTFIGFWENTWAESLAGDDRQQFVILGPGNVVWVTPWKALENSGVWQQHLYELIGAPSATFDVYFAAVNDGAGGRTALYVDEVHVWACSPGAMPMTALAGEAAPSTFSEPALTTEAVPFTPDASQYAVPPVPGEPAAPAETASPTPIVVPLSAGPAPESRAIEGTQVVGELTPFAQGTPVPLGTALDISGLPTPGWTEVAISGQPTSTPVFAAGAEPLPSTTPPPPDGRAIATPDLNPAALLTQAVSAVETVAPSPTRLPFGLLNGIAERTAQWPIPWYWVLLIIIVVVAGLIWLIRRSSRGNYYTP